MAADDRRPSPPTADPGIVRVEIRRLQLPVLESLDAAHGPTTGSHRELTVVALRGDNGVVGWGECAALATAGYWHETASSAFDTLSGVATDLVGRTALDLIDPSIDVGIDRRGRPMAAAALEMAVLDLCGKSEGRSLADILGSGHRSVPAGAAVGLGPTATVAGRVADLADEGYGRVKVKIEPETAETVVAAVVDRLSARFETDNGSRFQAVELHVDANGGYSTGANLDPTCADSLVGLARLGVEVIEQPFAADDEAAAADLRSALIDTDLPTLVMADEAVVSIESARAIFAAGVGDGAVIKPSRLGGLLPARDAIATLAADGAAVAVGGMVESALGRRSLAAVAALDGVSVTGDLSPARRWLADDPWLDVETTVVDGALHVLVPATAGVAPSPDPDKIARYTVDVVAAGR